MFIVADFCYRLICGSLFFATFSAVKWGSAYTRDGLYASIYGSYCISRYRRCITGWLLWLIFRHTCICCGECVELSGHEGPVQSFSWKSSGATLASTCKDKQLRVFDVRAATVAQVTISCYDIWHLSQPWISHVFVHHHMLPVYHLLLFTNYYTLGVGNKCE